jgi:NADPH-dependent ferric siderophore reductase
MDPTNPLTLLIPLIGIALILTAVWLTGAPPARLDRALVLVRLGEDLPDFVADEIVIDAGRTTALAAAADGTLVVVFAAGDRVVVRALERGEVRRVGVDGDRLTIDTDAFTHRRFALMLPGAASRWARRLLPSAGRA